MPPMLLGALRFTLAAVPAVFFVRRPQIPWRLLVLYGATIQLGQFVFLFTGMYVGMPAGLASLVLQSQAFFTLVFAMLFLGERLRMQNLLGPRSPRAGRRDRGAGRPRDDTRGLPADDLLGRDVGVRQHRHEEGRPCEPRVARRVASLVPPVPFFLLSCGSKGRSGSRPRSPG